MELDGCIEMYGAHIRLCIRDFAVVHKHINTVVELRKKTRGEGKRNRLNHLIWNYLSAKDYLFGGQLEESIDRYNLPLEAQAVKRHALKMAEDGIDDRRGRYNESIVDADCEAINA